MSQFKTDAKKQNMQMGELLKTIRNEKEITMRHLAAILDTPHSFIGKTEKATRRLDVGEFIEYCKALDSEPAEVLNRLLKITEN